MNNQTIPLTANWTLSFTHPMSGQHITIPATVPGNVEIDLQREGFLDNYYPADQFHAMRVWEQVDDWVYETCFDAPFHPSGHSIHLVFEGIDTIADVLLNGEIILRCENMQIPHTVDISQKAQPKDNTLTVRIYSTALYARQFPYNASTLYRDFKHSQAYMRKAAHMWGWDNAPRLLSAGLWRPVSLAVLAPLRFTEVYAYTQMVRQDITWIGVNWAFVTPDTDLSGYRGRILLAYHGKTEFSFDFEVNSTYGVFNQSIATSDLKLWMPRGYGEPHLYDLTVQIIKQDKVAEEWHGRMGIRELELIHSEYINEQDEGDFHFVCNGEKIYINGTNWKPLDALHSRAAAKIKQALDLCLDLHCNMVRIWGGGVYEDHQFFDYCDEHGLLVWQDFMFACGFPPRDDFFLQAVAHEAKVIIKRLRNHPSLATWCGDNEVDATFTWNTLIPKFLLPSDNVISRRILKDAVLTHDPYRSYVESSPYISDDIARHRWKEPGQQPRLATPEHHLYPGDENFRSAYRSSRSRFFGETGPFFINAMSENPAMIETERNRIERLWDIPINRQDYTIERHQVDEYFLTWKDACRKRLGHFFGKDLPFEPWHEFCLGVNIICADMFKFVIEYSRSCKWKKTGVLWWSLLDMWPMMFNYSVVDYSFTKKLPYYWIRQSQQPFCLLAVEQREQRGTQLFAANDTLESYKGSYVINAFSKEEHQHIASGNFAVDPNQNQLLQRLENDEQQQLWIIEWKSNGHIGFNHFVTGKPPYDFDQWKQWNTQLLSLYIQPNDKP